MLWVERLRDSHQKVKVKVKWIYIAPSRETSKGVFIATLLNSTRRRIELCRYRHFADATQLNSIATQLNSTQLTQLPSWTAYSQSVRSRSVVFLFMTS